MWLTGAGAMPLSAYLPLVPSGSAGNLSVFPETLMYGGGLSVICRQGSTSTGSTRDIRLDKKVAAD